MIVIGALFAVSVLIGAALATSALLAVVGMFLLAIGAAALAASRPFGLIAMNLCVPLTGIGLSFDDIGDAASFGALILVGSLAAYLISLAFPEFTAPNRPPRSTLARDHARMYGFQLGLVAATATAVGFALGIEHIGWIAGAALLVSRPSQDMARLRSVGRVVSVLCGALLASWLLSLHLPPLAIAGCTGAAIIGAAAMHASRWYSGCSCTPTPALLPSNSASRSAFSRRSVVWPSPTCTASCSPRCCRRSAAVGSGRTGVLENIGADEPDHLVHHLLIAQYPAMSESVGAD